VKLVRKSVRVLKGASQFKVRAEGGATAAARHPPDAAEPKGGIFCLPAFVEDDGRISFSRCRLPQFFLHVPKS
jgi:hypothetical protein